MLLFVSSEFLYSYLHYGKDIYQTIFTVRRVPEHLPNSNKRLTLDR